VETKHICVLANSVKFNERCIAGMEVYPASQEHSWKLSNKWVRPISHRADGAISVMESRLAANGRQPQLRDIIEIDLAKRANIAGHPEDWLIEPGRMWRHKGRFPNDIVPKFVETPDGLWLENPLHRDRVSPDFLQQTNAQSLYLIQPESFRIYIREDSFSGKTTKKRRGIFIYQGNEYDLGLTDPKMQAKYFPNFQQMSEGWVAPGPPSVAALCISLTPVFETTGYHYKLVAAVFE
jgi:hypothetical protein